MVAKIIITDLSRVLLFPKDASYKGGLNALNNKMLDENPNYEFFDYFRLNEELLAYYKDINAVTPVHIFTSEDIQNHPAINNTLKTAVSSILSARELKVEKSEPSAYKRLLEALSAEPKEAVYVDDQPANLAAAAQTGIQTIQYTNNKTTMAELDYLVRQTS